MTQTIFRVVIDFVSISLLVFLPNSPNHMSFCIRCPSRFHNHSSHFFLFFLSISWSRWNAGFSPDAGSARTWTPSGCDVYSLLQSLFKPASLWRSGWIWGHGRRLLTPLIRHVNHKHVRVLWMSQGHRSCEVDGETEDFVSLVHRGALVRRCGIFLSRPVITLQVGHQLWIELSRSCSRVRCHPILGVVEFDALCMGKGTVLPTWGLLLIIIYLVLFVLPHSFSAFLSPENEASDIWCSAGFLCLALGFFCIRLDRFLYKSV